jgi:ribonuclease D
VTLCRDDIPEGALGTLLHRRSAWDIETNGLDWREARIDTCQVAAEDGTTFIVRFSAETPSPPRLTRVLQDASSLKLFHHATFDLSFMRHHWRVRASNVACTKIASKILQPSRADHSLKKILNDYLGITLMKDQRVRLSDWSVTELSAEQLRYASDDVRYLALLFEVLRRRLNTVSRWELAAAAFAFLPVNVELKMQGLVDVYAY